MAHAISSLGILPWLTLCNVSLEFGSHSSVAAMAARFTSFDSDLCGGEPFSLHWRTNLVSLIGLLSLRPSVAARCFMRRRPTIS